MSLCTSTEYRQLGHQFTEFMYFCSLARKLVSHAYPARSKIFKAIATAHDQGVFGFKTGLESLAYTEHPGKNFTDDFNSGAWREDWQPPLTLPGCSPEESDLFFSALAARSQAEKRQPLTPGELQVLARFLAHIHDTCRIALDRATLPDEEIPPEALKLLHPSWLIVDAFCTIKQESRRVQQ